MNATARPLETERLPRPSTPRLAINAKASGSRLFFIVATTLVSLIALLLSGYLAYAGLTSSAVVGCDGGVFNCDHVLTSRWAKLFGLPVSLLAVLLYSIIIAAIALLRSHTESSRRIASSVIMASAAAATTAAVWFMSVQVFAIGHLCPYCIVVHTCGVLVLALMLWQQPLPWIKIRYSTTVGVVAGMTLIAVQAATPVPQTFTIQPHETTFTPESSDTFADPLTETRESESTGTTNVLDPPGAILIQPLWFLTALVQADDVPASPETPILVPISGGRKTLDARKWPVWGNVDGKYVIVEMFDYTCEHCRNTHHAIRDARTRLGNEFGVVMLAVPLHRDCNDAATSRAPEPADSCEIATLAVAVWLVDSTKFTEFHDWLFAQARTAREAKAQAALLIGRKRLSEELAKGTAAKYIAKNVLLYKDAGAGTVPKIIASTTTLVGEVSSGTAIAEVSRKTP